MDETRQEKRVIGLDAHPYMFSAAALSGSHALHAQVEWSVDRIPLKSLGRILKKRANPGDIVVLEASANTFALAERLLRIGFHPIVLESQSVGKIGKTYCREFWHGAGHNKGE